MSVVKPALLALTLWASPHLMAPGPTWAQPQGLSISQTRAANLARMRAESLNGGVANYRADRCMYSTGAPACLVSASVDGYVFRFRGGPPGWQQRNPAQPTTLTTVTVTADGETILDVNNAVNGVTVGKGGTLPDATPR